jgi:hypothetical protein
MRRTLVAGLLALGVLGAGCMVVTGSTDGYTTAPTSFGCFGPSDCEGGVCCYDVTGDGGATASCKASCDFALEQACTASDQCGDGGTCYEQTCSVEGGASFQVATCGKIPRCAQ